VGAGPKALTAVSGHLARDAGSLDPKASLPRKCLGRYVDVYGLIQLLPSGLDTISTLSKMRVDVAQLFSFSSFTLWGRTSMDKRADTSSSPPFLELRHITFP
jgi:hypothetical protein